MSRCKHCGARSIPFRKVCDYCGTPADQGFENPTQGEKDPGSPGSGTDFERLMAHPDLARIVQAGPQVEPPRQRREGFPKELLLLAFFGFVFWKSGGSAKLNSGVSVVPLLFVGLTIVAMLRRRSRTKSFPGTHVESLPVRVNEVQTDEHWPRAGTVKVMVEMQSGERRRLLYRGTGNEQWAARDMGVAHIKANVLVEFHKLTL